MSDVNTVAETMGIPPDLVSRSAAARAAESGTSTEDVLAAWAGGAPVESKPSETTPEPAPEPEAEKPDAEEPASEEPEKQEPEPTEALPPTIPRQPEIPAPRELAGSEPPVLVGARDNPWAVVAGAIGLFVAVVLLGLLGPSVPTDDPGARSGEISYSEAGQAGQGLYQSLGCAGCHTQMVRPVVADVGIGPVTLSDSNQVLGLRRFGPDLSDIGSRMSGTQMEATIRGGSGHPGHNLSNDDMSNLVTYLLESSQGGGGS